MVIVLKSMLSHLAAASAAVWAVWCIDSSHLLRQETQENSLNNHDSVVPLSQPSHSLGAATLEAAGESTVTWAPHDELGDQTYPIIVRGGRTTSKQGRGRHSDQDRQDPTPSNATVTSRAMSKNERRRRMAVVASPEVLVEEGNDLRLCNRTEFEGEQGPGTYSHHDHAGIDFSWDVPFSHKESDVALWTSTCSCTQQSSGEPAYWFVKFADGNLHHVAKIRLWNREDGVQWRLNGACVRFTEDGTKPLNNETGCELYLPEIAYNSSGTEVVIDRSINGMMIISLVPTWLHICGIQIYEGYLPTSTTTTTSTPAGTTSTTSTTTAPEEEANHVVPFLIGGAVLLVLAAVGVAYAMGIIQIGPPQPQPTDAAPADVFEY